ncbi:S49 family peptidase [Gluconobacter kondonii]|uniref:S49 family peptidase n=1 Tax=Gluconobacter kondonii TaxID=941463 RepID=UPI00197ED5B5|nr:S49 family peptidase [Gluconobacter kondonii]MBN3866445.1 S49 family peptidase [Gluconobacter kondonii]
MKRVQADAILNRPLALSLGRAGILKREIEASGVLAFFNENDGWFAGAPVWRSGNIAAIGIGGVLLAGKGSFYPYVTCYGDIRESFDEALADDTVQAIVLAINSPGGMVSELFDLADHIYASRSAKPIVAILADEAYSAGYALASSAQTITVPRTGGSGSIGVIMMHTDLTKALSDAGIAVTVFRYGEHKAELNSVEPLTDGARERAQADINRIGEMFIDLVARNRGLSPDAIRDMKAETFLGEDGVKLGLADAVMSPDAALEDLRANLT